MTIGARPDAALVEDPPIRIARFACDKRSGVSRSLGAEVVADDAWIEFMSLTVGRQ